MKSLTLVKFGLALALGSAVLPSLCATSTIAFARGDGGASGGGGAAGGGGGGSEGGGGGSVLVPGGGNTPPRNPPRRNPSAKGEFVLREVDRTLPSCIDYRRGLYSFYGAPIPVRCQPYVYFYDAD
jgi:hypothetical protein